MTKILSLYILMYIEVWKRSWNACTIHLTLKKFIWARLRKFGRERNRFRGFCFQMREQDIVDTHRTCCAPGSENTLEGSCEVSWTREDGTLVDFRAPKVIVIRLVLFTPSRNPLENWKQDSERNRFAFVNKAFVEEWSKTIKKGLMNFEN